MKLAFFYMNTVDIPPHISRHTFKTSGAPYASQHSDPTAT